ncbi:hypothetical protein [Brachybacterium nesterenkovii]|uniref:Uncharacterized protein n=1 Tax=Brachybacterium nesterenkovii TaxID=47847 RepID=A0A1X6WZG9_9MICO|nr:hypothetical protein [Brachybacterium nesterenkovii]SLM91310.1 hypothetical protein FM110_06385 [Brachybacterium nesterenkovii]
METINLGAVLFALLLLVWLLYAVPRIAERRDLMGHARAVDLSRDSRAARDLTDAAHHRRRDPEVHAAMPENRLLTRPVDPTRRPRFEEPARIDVETAAPAGPGRRVRAVLLAGLVALTALAVVLAVIGAVAWYVPLVPVAILAGYVALLRRAELSRRERLRQEVSARRRALAGARSAGGSAASAGATEAEQCESEAPSAAPAPAPRPGEWTPRPVPRPAYSLRGDVDDLDTRHAAHRASVLGTSVPLENEGVEEQEAARERVESLPVAADLGLDEILARRRGA